MAAAAKPKIELEYDAEGDFFRIGFKLNGKFVPVASVSGGYARALADANGDDEAPSDDDEGGES